jgi:biopolymer transport protein ExbB
MVHSVILPRPVPVGRIALLLFLCLVLLALAPGPFGDVSKGQLFAQNEVGSGEDVAGPRPETVAAEIVPDATQPDASDTEPAGPPDQLRLFWLLMKGGPLMIPIAFMSVFVVALVIERFIGLRRTKVMPPDLIHDLGQATSTSRGFDPRHLYRLCQQYPSATSNVVRAMLLKVGRPQSEVEHAAVEASDREANRMYANVRWLNLAAAISPLMGLLGTVWGMIRAFFDTTQLEVGQNKGDFLAAGIYVALVTTLGGLAVAIPAAIFAHYFEGRIQSLFHQIDELLFNLLPQAERYEGRLRVSRQSLADGDATATEEGPASQPSVSHTTHSTPS